MLLTLSTTHTPATDLGYLLHKNPARVQAFDLSFGKAHVFYPQATAEACTAALLLEVDPIGLVRNRRGPSGEGFSLEQYVNDRPYVASSFLSVAISQVFGSALSGKCRDKPELAEQAIPLVARLPVVPCRGGEVFLRKLFEPLGYVVEASRLPLDEQFPEWGESPYFALELSGTVRATDLLSHLYVLVPVLDDDKHYWIGPDEVEKLLRHGEGWLASHPAKEQIVQRYLRRRWNLTRDALARLAAEDAPPVDVDQVAEQHAAEEEAAEQPLCLNDQRLAAVVAALLASGSRRVLDLGCSSGNLLRRLLEERQFTEIVGLDVSHRALEIAAARLKLERLPQRQQERVKLLHGSLTYRDKRLSGYDAAALVEVIEHLDPPRLAALERNIFQFARPKTIVVTTPNVEYNPLFPTLPAGKLRHKDHRFEWTREQFRAWCEQVGQRFGYTFDLSGIGAEDAKRGSPTQMAVFSSPLTE
jgi:3' terminal RNA ribose 2'-O-methyltransferase Hen1